MVRISVILLATVLWSISVAEALAVPVTFLVTPPAGTDAGAEIHLAGNFQNWQPGDPAWRLKPTLEGQYSLTADFKEGQGLQFKFTLGTWPTVEKGLGGAEIPNRRHVVAGSETLNLDVIAWADGKPTQRPQTLVGNVQTLTVPGFLNGRRVWVYLPPGYGTNSDRHYPVLYMFDGQNVFNDATSFAGEWQVDESLERLIAAGLTAPLIVVAVDNGGGARVNEYTPWPSAIRARSGGGQEHLQAWIETLMPFIDEKFRTLTGPEHTGLAGSSLGGLMSLYGGFAHPDVFGRIGAFSSSLEIAGQVLFDFCGEQPGRPGSLYTDMGTREGGNLTDHNGNGTDDAIEALRRLQRLLQERGYVGGWDLMVVEAEGANHNEQAWARRFPAAVEFLFPAK